MAGLTTPCSCSLNLRAFHGRGRVKVRILHILRSRSIQARDQSTPGGLCVGSVAGVGGWLYGGLGRRGLPQHPCLFPRAHERGPHTTEHCSVSKLSFNTSIGYASQTMAFGVNGGVVWALTGVRISGAASIQVSTPITYLPLASPHPFTTIARPYQMEVISAIHKWSHEDGLMELAGRELRVEVVMLGWLAWCTMQPRPFKGNYFFSSLVLHLFVCSLACLASHVVSSRLFPCTRVALSGELLCSRPV